MKPWAVQETVQNEKCIITDFVAGIALKIVAEGIKMQIKYNLHYDVKNGNKKKI